MRESIQTPKFNFGLSLHQGPRGQR
jgi:hypothetical protein